VIKMKKYTIPHFQTGKRILSVVLIIVNVLFLLGSFTDSSLLPLSVFFLLTAIIQADYLWVTRKQLPKEWSKEGKKK